jgi:DNA primase
MLVPSSSSRKLLERATREYEQALDGSVADLYLKNRSLTNETAKRFRLGYVENPLPGHEAYGGRLAIPYLTASGVVDIRFKSVPSDGDPTRPVVGAKILALPGATLRPYNTLALSRHEQFVCITEGEPDTWTTDMAGIPVVGFPGVKSWQKLFWRMFRFRRVAILAQRDDSGQGEKFSTLLAEQIPGAVIIPMPEGHDVNSYVMQEGIEALRRKVGLSGS